MASIRDVAKLAGVSIATVSRVINKKGYVREETVKQVERAIKQLKYKLNPLSTVQSKSQSLLAFLVDDYAPFMFSTMLRSIQVTADKEGFEVLIWNTSNKSIADLIRHFGVAGVIITASAYKRMMEPSFSVPYIVLKEEVENNYESSKTATLYLLARGVKFPAFLKGAPSLLMSERLEAFIDTVEENRVPYRVIEDGSTINKAEQAIIRAFRDAPFVDAILASSELAAIGVIRAAHILHLSVPGRLQVMGFDGSEIGEMIYPTITTVQTNSLDQTKDAVMNLIQQIKHIPVSRNSSNHYIVERESTKH